MENDVPVWKMSRGQYQAQQGVPRPHVCEISPMQYASMSKRQKGVYDKKRAAEWEASAVCGMQYEAMCYRGYTDGVVTLESPELHPEARDAIQGILRRKAAQEQKDREKDASRDNLLDSMDQVQVGDRIFSLLFSQYVTVVKKNKVSLIVRLSEGRELKTNIRGCQRLSYNDLMNRVRGAA